MFRPMASPRLLLPLMAIALVGFDSRPVLRPMSQTTVATRAYLGLTQFGPLQDNRVDFYAGTSRQVRVYGRTLTGRFGDPATVETSTQDGVLMVTVRAGVNTNGNLLAIPYNLTVDDVPSGPARVVVRHCWASACMTIADTSLTVK